MIITQIKNKIERVLPGSKVLIEDTSSSHQGHNPDSLHLSIEVIYSEFKGKSLLEQHQMIYDILKLEMKEIHALKIKTKVE